MTPSDEGKLRLCSQQAWQGGAAKGEVDIHPNVIEFAEVEATTSRFDLLDRRLTWRQRRKNMVCYSENSIVVMQRCAWRPWFESCPGNLVIDVARDMLTRSTSASVACVHSVSRGA